MQELENLLRLVENKNKHNKVIARLKGEQFNIFSLLNMESSENATHSRFLAELLNPKGSHGLGHIFLEVFIKNIRKNFDGETVQNFSSESASVTVEKSLGKRDDILKQGGRVDIAITDGKGYSIFIENKIYASDQNTQIERYCNYDKNCAVVYLTRYGEDASVESKGDLISGTDYYCISYKKDIVGWLELCTKESVDQPILRETIKQYKNLIKKLTGQLMSHQLDREVKKLIADNLESAELIAKNLISAKNQIYNMIRDGLKAKLEHEQSLSNYTIKGHVDAGNKNSGLWFYHKEVDESLRIHFGIEPFSGNGNKRNDLFIGLIDLHGKHNRIFEKYSDTFPIIGWWRGVKCYQFENSKVCFSDIEFIQQLNKNPKILDELLNELTQQTVDFISKHEQTYISICNKAYDTLNVQE